MSVRGGCRVLELFSSPSREYMHMVIWSLTVTEEVSRCTLLILEGGQKKCRLLFVATIQQIDRSRPRSTESGSRDT